MRDIEARQSISANSYQTIKQLLEFESFQDGKIHRKKVHGKLSHLILTFCFHHPEKTSNHSTGTAPANDHIANRNRRVAVRDRPPLHGDSTRPFCLVTNLGHVCLSSENGNLKVETQKVL